jgi:hypothetical protein
MRRAGQLFSGGVFSDLARIRDNLGEER